MKDDWRRVPHPKWDKLCKYQSIGFVHISRTGGTYLSLKMLLGIWDVHPWKHKYVDHRLIPRHSLKERSAWFTVVRHPYDRIASELKRFDLTASELAGRGSPPQDGHFCRQTSLAVFADSICRYESLPQDVNTFLRQHGLPLVNFNDFAPQSHHLEQKDREIIFSLYKEDFEAFGYFK